MTKNIATAKDINAALMAIGLPALPVDAIRAIAETNRELFLDELQSAVQNDGTLEKQKKVADWIKCLSLETRAKVVSLGYPENLLAMATVGCLRPVRFLSALEVAANQFHPSNIAAKAFLADLLASSLPVTPISIKPVDVTSRDQTESPRGIVPTNSTNNHGDNKFAVHHAYGSNYALCFNAIQGKDGKPGIMIDAAVNVDDRYQWDSALHFWINERELDGLLAVLRRWKPTVELSGHGRRNDKTFKLDFQKTHFFASVVERGAKDHPTRAVKVSKSDARLIAMLIMNQLIAAHPNIPAAEIFDTIRAVHTDSPDRTIAA